MAVVTGGYGSGAIVTHGYGGGGLAIYMIIREFDLTVPIDYTFVLEIPVSL